MSVLIKGMEMPEGIEMLVVFSDGTVHKCLPGMREYAEKGIAVSIPTHGRLIDADALYRKMFVGLDGQIYPNNDVDNWPHTMAFKDIKHHILCAPTIIPTEENNYND